MAVLNFYIYSRFLKKLSPAFSRYAAVIPLLLMIGNLFFMLDIVTGFIPDSPALYIITSSFVGITFILFVIAIFYDLSVTVSSKVPFDMERRKTIKIIFDVTMLIAAISYLLRGLSQGLKLPVVNHVTINLDDFPIERYSIVQLTDVHIGRTIRRDFIEHLVLQTNQLAPDIVVITGDLVDLPIEKLKQDLLPLAELEAPCYFILGNHEYFHGPEAILDYLRTLGIKPLLNDCTIIEHEQGRFNLLGINDQAGARLGMLPADIPRAYAKADPALPSIVLAHQPKTILQLDEYPCDLMLSGHTHGGQIFPFGLLVMMDQPYLAGLYRHANNKQIFVSRGTGYWGPPIRLLSPSEISHIVLQPAQPTNNPKTA